MSRREDVSSITIFTLVTDSFLLCDFSHMIGSLLTYILVRGQLKWGEYLGPPVWAWCVNIGPA